MGPAVLADILKELPKKIDKNLLVGPETSDDAAVYRISDDLALIVTVDFFTPMVDDPYLFGQIAAANALSDIYAMGGKPLLALNVACFPNCLPREDISGILRGGADKVIEAGAVIGGGHTVQDDEPKYGLAAIGLAHPGEVLSNATARTGDLLVLTKPLGTGVINTAIKGGLAGEDAYRAAVEQMKTLNKEAALVVKEVGAAACTDITGFGFLGHGSEMARASGVSMVIDSSSVPVLPEALAFARMGLLPAGAYDNRRFLEREVVFEPGVALEMQDILFDPQTSGGLFVAVAPDKAGEMVRKMRANGVCEATVVGRVVAAEGYRIKVLG
jgi:selenide,water dikinase